VHHFRSAQEFRAKQNQPFMPVTPTVINLNDHPGSWDEELLDYHKTGIQAIREGKVAAIIMSGGQGTRLGFNGPKGVYDIGLPSHKPIFQIHMERILKVKQLCASGGSEGTMPSVPVYIMTSDLNHQIIKDYFENHNYFGYPKEDIIFFEQGLEPCFTFDGKMIVESPTNLSLAPDGNGGLYRALQHSGCVEDIRRRGVEYLHVYGIDNVLTKSLDPLFMGLCIAKDVQCGNKVVWRAHKAEKVGVTAELDGRMHILEYSEIPPELAETEDDTGRLLFGAANICNHYLSVSFLVNTVLPNLSSIYHFANKKIPYYDPSTGTTVTPAKPNGVKLEMFIFDVFPLADKWVVMESHRDDEFAPVKNEPGNPADSPDTARLMLSNQAIRWLSRVGAIVNQSDSKQLCEISPLLSYAGEGLESYKDVHVTLPCYLQTTL
jgi:UDP-N-acetylglucosamine/UDP-N-acetylgalactosamine diphosphorylase